MTNKIDETIKKIWDKSDTATRIHIRGLQRLINEELTTKKCEHDKPYHNYGSNCSKCNKQIP